MTLLDQNWISLAGDPIGGRAPTQTLVYGPPMTADQAGWVRQAYHLFCTAKLTMVGRFLTRERQFPDGTRLRMTSINGIDTVLVWTPEGGPNYVLYRGLAYAASVPDAVGEFGEHFRYPFDGTANDYGTRQSYLSSAVPTSVLTPSGQHLKQTVARLVKRADVDGEMLYRDRLRGILEGGRILQFTAQPYWVREATGEDPSKVFHDTDEVWTTAGDIVWCNNKAIAAYVSGVYMVEEVWQDWPIRSLAFPFKNKVVVLTVSGSCGYIPRRKTPRDLAQPGLDVFIQAEGPNYHPVTDDRDVPTQFFLPPGWAAQLAVNQSGTQFALFDGAGRGLAYDLEQDTGTGEVSTVQFLNIDTSFSEDIPTPYYTTTSGTGAPASANPFAPSLWPSGITITDVYQNGNSPFDALGIDRVPTTAAPQKHETGQNWTRDYAENIDETHTIALAFVDDALTQIDCHTVAGADGTLTITLRQELWSQATPDLGGSPPFGYSFVGSSVYKSVLDVVPDGDYWKYSGTTSTNRIAESWDYTQSGSGFSSGITRTVETFYGPIKIFENTAEFDVFEYSYSQLEYRAANIGSHAVAGITVDDYDMDSTVQQYAESFTVDSMRKSVTRQILLLDQHNQVLAYFESGSETHIDAALTASAFRPAPGFVDGVPQNPTNFNAFPTTQKKYAKVVVVFGGEEFVSPEVHHDSSFNSILSSVMLPFDSSTYMGGSPVESDAFPAFPVMQGMCPYMAYRKPNTEKAEMVFAHSGTVPNVTPTDYLNSAFTEQGVEDWLTSCGVPAAITTRVATCFRVGGPKVSQEK